MIAAGRALRDLDRLGLDDEARRLFLKDDAVRVFGLAHP
jgi:predicted TIM-barrel fold metal-dependent hydrolase